MDTDSRKLFEEIMDQSIDPDLKRRVGEHLNDSTYETQCIAKDDLQIIFEELNPRKITNFQMMQIAEILKEENVTDDFWRTLEEATKIVLHLENDVIPENLRTIY